MNKNFNRTNAVLIFSLIVFVAAVGYFIIKESARDDYAINRADVIKFFSERINEVSPEKPVLGGKWFVTRFRFVDPAPARQGGIDTPYVYVEYEDGHIARAFLLSVTRSVGSAPDYKITGFFEPGSLGYKLLAGEDVAKDKPQEIYEYNATAGEWIKVN